jgi:uncharacterized protein (TIGR01777 family)
MPVKTFETVIPASPEDLFAWHCLPGAFDRLRPPWQSIEIEEQATVVNGSRVRLRLKRGPFRVRWIAEHRDVEPGRGFTDIQTAGPFKRWIHQHEFEASDGATVLRDRIDYEIPGGTLGRALAGGLIRRDLESTFAFRHETTRRDLARHRSFLRQPRLRVAVSGASGLVGGNLVPFLTTGGHQVVRLVRGTAGQADTVTWHPEAGLDSPESLTPFDAVVHLAGESIAAGRWTRARKERIRSSRIDGTRNLVRSLGRMTRPPKVIVCASAIGYYGSRGDEVLDEASRHGEGFLAQVCREWEEAAAREAVGRGIRVVMARLGIVLSPAGGALAKMLPPFELGAGGRLGDGRQYMSWVSIDDAVGAIYQALLDDRLSGPINVVAPQTATNREFTQLLGGVLRRPALIPVPRLGTRILFGEMADEMLLASTRVRPRRLEEAGFIFGDTDLERTFARLLGKLRWS